ncbi:MAG: hypothetical protein KDB37_05550 [Ilumatobacter sp.]|nr:hypothetical protein [Ilumatobacter sp.]
MTEYRYLAVAVPSGEYLGDLPLSAVTFGEELEQQVSELTASLDLNAKTRDGRSLAARHLAWTTPRVTAIFVEADGVLVWAGVVYGRQRPSTTMRLRALNPWAYFGRRRLTESRSYVGVDQLTVAADLVSWAQAVPGGDLGVLVDAATSGVVVDRNPIANSWEYRPIAELVEELAQSDPGFEFAIVPDGRIGPRFRLQFWYPQRGSATVSALWSSRSGRGSIVDFTWDEDGLGADTVVYGIGAGEGESSIRTVATLADGAPITEAVMTWKSITNVDTVASLTRAEVANRARLVGSMTLELDSTNPAAAWGAWSLGDLVRIVVEDDPRFTETLDVEQRVVGWQRSIDDDGKPDALTVTTRTP